MKNKYFANLDGLRAIAAFAVMFFHICLWVPKPSNNFTAIIRLLIGFNGYGGDYGVIFFFILSGFLITYLLIREREKFGKINILFFYCRRALRIWPLYYIVLVIGFYIYPLYLHRVGEIYGGKENIFLYLSFLANVDYDPWNGMLGVQWSVSVEEQFYLFWPLLFIFIKRSNWLPVVFISLFIFSETCHILLINDSGGKFHSSNCISYLSFGGLMGYLSYFNQKFIQTAFDRLNRISTFLIYFFCLGFLFFTKELNAYFKEFRCFEHIVPILFFAFVIMEQNYSAKSFFKIGKFKFMNKLGKISYGLYLTHMISVYIILRSPMFNKEGCFIYNLFLIPFITIVLSSLSYWFFESRFLELKTRFSMKWGTEV